MVTIYKSAGGELQILEEVQDGAWVNLVAPTEAEIKWVTKKLKADPDDIRAALDEEERSRIETNDDTGHHLIVVDIPYAETERDSRMYDTIPLGIIYTETGLLTVCLQETSVLQGFINNAVKTFYTFKKSRFVLQILSRNASLYLQYLKQIDKHSIVIESELHKSMKNKGLIQLLDLEKSLVYFSTSLRSNELVMEKLLRYEFIKKYPEDTDLLEDIIIENKQAMEMAKIYSDILNSTMNAVASIISNNLNIVMKALTSITIVMAIPTMVSSFFGMNVPIPLGLQQSANAFFGIVLASVLICCVISLFMVKKKLF